MVELSALTPYALFVALELIIPLLITVKDPPLSKSTALPVDELVIVVPLGLFTSKSLTSANVAGIKPALIKAIVTALCNYS